MFLFSQPPPLRISLISISPAFSHCSKWTMGVPGPRLSPLFLPVSESTELGRSLPRRVASTTAARRCSRSASWLMPTGVLILKVGIPVSWQMGPSSRVAMSMLVAMTLRAWDACVVGVSDCRPSAMARRTSGGRLVEVSLMSSRILS